MVADYHEVEAAGHSPQRGTSAGGEAGTLRGAHSGDRAQRPWGPQTPHEDDPKTDPNPIPTAPRPPPAPLTSLPALPAPNSSLWPPGRARLASVAAVTPCRGGGVPAASNGPFLGRLTSSFIFFWGGFFSFRDGCGRQGGAVAG